MKFLKFFFPIFLLTFLACETSGTNSGNSKPNAGTDSKPPITNTLGETVPINQKPGLADLEKVAQVMSTSNFNEEAAAARENGESWTGSPITVALRFAGEEFDSRTKNIDVESLSGGESFDKVLISITEDGFLDDSIRGSMVILRMESVNGFWNITSAKKVWRCWENRGHVAYNSEPCH